MTANEFRQVVAQGLFASDRVAGRLEMLREFNIFRTLRLDQHEIRHSNMIGWLLDPHETHDLGSKFLSAFLNRLHLSFTEEQLQRFVVKREERYKDIVLISECRRTVIVVENKWNACERISMGDREGQLRAYYSELEADSGYNGWQKHYVYLTPTGRLPSEENRGTWIPMSYRDIVDVLESEDVVALLTDESRQPQRLAISQYLGVIKSRSDMMTREERSEWLDVYLSQKDAFDTVFEISRNVVQEMLLGEMEKDVGDVAVDSQVKTCSVNVRPQFLVNGLSEYLGVCPFTDSGKAVLDVYWYDNGRGAKTPYRFWFSPDRDPWRWCMSLTVRLEGLTEEQQEKVRYLDGRIFDVEHRRTPGWTLCRVNIMLNHISKIPIFYGGLFFNGGKILANLPLFSPSECGIMRVCANLYPYQKGEWNERDKQKA